MLCEAFMALADTARWLSKLAREVGPDGLSLVTPPGIAYAFAKYLFAPDRHIPADDLEARDPEAVRLWAETFEAIGDQYFRWKVSGIEHVPASGRALIVGSHNGGLMVSDSALTMAAIYKHHGPERRLYSLSHDVLHSNETLRRVASRAGVLRAGHNGGARALRDEHLVLVYPGSDLDATRPFKDRYKIELGGRKGFLRLALRERAPIVPVVSVGTHEQWIVLTRGDGLAKLFNTKKWLRLEVCPIVLSVPWGLTSGVLPYFPMPAQTSIAFAKPIAWPELEPSAADDPVILARCYEEVRAALQTAMDELARGRRTFFG
jgi:1-acyl-sn-glycerol-3-phosphate acyltransferase